MTAPVYKLILFLKRRAGMSVQEFRDYYETSHRAIGEKFLAGMTRYVRRYLDPTSTVTSEAIELPFDVITEVWCPIQNATFALAVRRDAPAKLWARFE